MTQTLVYLAVTFAAAPPTAEDPRITVVKAHGCAKVDPKVIAALVAQLGDESFARREQASKALLRLGPQALPAIKAAQAGSDLEVAARASRLSGALQWQAIELPEKLRGLLANANPGVVEELLSVPDRNTRWLVIQIVGEVEMTDTVRRLLIRRTDRADVAEKSKLLEAVGGRVPKDIGYLEGLFREKEACFREAACHFCYLHEKRPERAVPLLLAGLKDPDLRVRRKAVQCMVCFPEPRVTDALISLLHKSGGDEDGEKSLASCAAISLESHNGETARVIGALSKIGPGAPKQVRLSATSTVSKLGRHGKEAAVLAVPYLLRTLSDPDCEVRSWAIGGLELCGDGSPDIVQALIGVLESDGPIGDKALAALHSSAASALGSYGHKSKAGVPALIRVLGRRGASFRERSAEALGQIGVDTPEIRHALRTAGVSEGNERLQEAASKAMERLGKKRVQGRGNVPSR